MLCSHFFDKTAAFLRLHHIILFYAANIKCGMEYLTVGLSFAIGLLLVLLLGWVFSLKSKGLMRLLVNSLAGIILLLCLALFKIVYVPLNPLNALLVGFLGAPGLAVVVLITMFL